MTMPKSCHCKKCSRDRIVYAADCEHEIRDGSKRSTDELVHILSMVIDRLKMEEKVNSAGYREGFILCG